MVVGNGLMAKTFSHYINDDSVLIFASGVSDSNMTNKLEFSREFNLLKEKLKTHHEKLFVYFSTCSIDDYSVRERPYINHKLKLESFIMENSKYFLIFRITNVVGPIGNQATVMNYFVNAILNNKTIEVWKNAERNFIDKDDLFYLVESMINKGYRNRIINLGMSFEVNTLKLVKIIEGYLHKEANLNLIDKGNKLNIDKSLIENELSKIKLQKGEGEVYIKYLLKKYY